MNHPIQSVSDIPPLIATSVVRGSEQGQVQAASNEDVALCGEKKVSIAASYDTHADLKASMASCE